MKIIDAHMHFSDHQGFARIAREAKHENTAAHLVQTFRENNIVFGIAMGTHNPKHKPDVCYPGIIDLAGEFDAQHYNQPSCIVYCAGVNGMELDQCNMEPTLEEFRKVLATKQCVGIKLYPGYDAVYPGDKRNYPFYELAREFDVPVVFHSGDTASSRALLKYSHPLAVDEVAVAFPDVRFVIAHYGSPWIVDATEVAIKNDNVYLDLSGLAAGYFTTEEYCRKNRGYLEHLKTWMAYMDDYSRLMYGSDWPLINIPSYIGVIESIIPEEHREAVFYENALRVFSKLNALL